MAETDEVRDEKLSGPDKESAFIKCESCGGNMVFDPETQALKCEHCGRVDNFAKNTEVCEQEIENAFSESVKWNDEATVYRCENCGAQFVVKADEVAVLCPYCSTSHVAKTSEIPGIKPNAVYPYLLTKVQAAARARKWVKNKIFAPRTFKKNLEEDNLRGVFFPCFTFDSSTSSVYAGRIGEYKTRTVTDSKGNTHTETYTSWSYVSGTYCKFFDDITLSCGSLSQAEMNRLMPFDQNSLCVYQQKFLSGYTANHYRRDISECWTDAKAIMDKQIRSLILARHHGDVIDYLNVSTMHEDVKYKYVLLPVYRLNYRYKKKDYPLMVNGNSGTVIGKTPLSPLRVAIAVILAIAALTAVGYYIYTDEDSERLPDGYTETIETADLSLDAYLGSIGCKKAA